MDTAVKEKFDCYPDDVREKLLQIREALFDVAKSEKLGDITETLKWGEPSYVSSRGSTVRIDWKSKYPDQFFIYFNCKSALIETFKELYGATFKYEGNRAIVFLISEPVPWPELKSCLSMALRYHSIKHLPLLGS